MRGGVVLAILLSATVVHADDLDPATVHIVGSGGFEIQHTNFLQSNATTLWTTICLSPCTTLGTTGGYYRAGQSGHPIFGPRHAEFTLRVDPPPGRINYPLLITGSALFVTGLPLFVVGLGYMSSPSASYDRWPAVSAGVGALTAGVGLLAIIGSIVSAAPGHQAGVLTVVSRIVSPRVVF